MSGPCLYVPFTTARSTIMGARRSGGSSTASIQCRRRSDFGRKPEACGEWTGRKNVRSNWEQRASWLHFYIKDHFRLLLFPRLGTPASTTARPAPSSSRLDSGLLVPQSLAIALLEIAEQQGAVPLHQQVLGDGVAPVKEPEDETRLKCGKIFPLTGVRYAEFLEFGTTKMGARPWLFPAFERNRKKAVARIKRAVNDAIQKAGRTR